MKITIVGGGGDVEACAFSRASPFSRSMPSGSLIFLGGFPGLCFSLSSRSPSKSLILVISLGFSIAMSGSAFCASVGLTA